ncbi:MAG TPA: C39 family peptidase [Bellilinea sp.]
MRYSSAFRAKKRWRFIIPIFAALLVITGALATQLPGIKPRLAWRVEIADAYLRGIINPVEQMPVPRTVQAAVDAATPTPRPTATPDPATATPTPEISPTPTPTPTPLPPSAKLEPAAYEKQDMNNCGPATLTMFLRMYGWEGDQFAISDLIKPIPQDRNVNVDELFNYTLHNVPFLTTGFRVGGTVETLKAFIAAGLPIMIEEGFTMAESYWPNDDRWSGHYLLLTAYDDERQVFTTQDSWLGENVVVSYTDLDKRWQTFNRVYFFAYRPEQEQTIRSILGENWDEDANRRLALETARLETEENQRNPFAWFNLGSNMIYFDRYAEAAQAYDEARLHGLPQRMLRYQFGPFFAYFNTNRTEDLLELAEYALKITPNSEEALLWRGWGLYRSGDKLKAAEDFLAALEAHPGYFDAEYALEFVRTN